MDAARARLAAARGWGGLVHARLRAVGVPARLESSWAPAGEVVANVAVAPARQRRGLALWMLEDELDEARTASMSVMYLEVRAGNDGAQSLYRRLGFVENGRRKGYYRAGAGREDAVLMMLELLGHK